MLKKLLPILLLCLLFTAGCDRAKKCEVVPDKSVPVEIIAVKPEPLTTYLEITSSLQPARRVQVVSKVSGELKDVMFDLGQKVEQDQVLAVVDDELYKAAYEQAFAGYKLATSAADRIEVLFNKQLASKQEYEAALSQKAAAETGYTAARLNYDNTRIKSPIAGIVAARSIEAGNNIAMGMPVAVIVDIDQIKVNVGVSEYDFARIAVNNGVKVEIDSLPGQVFTGRVTARGIGADPNDNTFPLEITIPNPGYKLNPGMLGRLTIDKTYYKNALLLPQDTILEKETGKFVYRVIDGKAVLTKVTPGTTNGSRVHIISGLRDNDLIIIKGHQNVLDGESVRIVGNAS
ncbi:MAG: efflux RND transporter periplasmic adaptor subunit [Candidatus Margulisiibacteriota bacterium]